mmetsp:Transcript_17466/g.22236  ORF Transcript_17466/g.22236 Transcript_17466/m.22236 type:complete len:235 (-) Transcript_17466:159-863(-)
MSKQQPEQITIQDDNSQFHFELNEKRKNLRGVSSQWRAISDDGPISERVDNAAVGAFLHRNMSIEGPDYVGLSSLLDNKIEIDNPLSDPLALRCGTLDYLLGENKANLAPPSPLPKASQADKIPHQFTDSDVLLGRGGQTNHHPGNIRFRKEAGKLKGWYCNVSKTEKYEISKLLVHQVYSYGGRFLAQEKDTESSGRWYQVEEKRARKKASQVLRENKKRKKEIEQSPETSER